MKTKNQSSLPSKYWLIIVIVICVILMGVERITGGTDQSVSLQTIQSFLCRKGSDMLDAI